MTSPFVSMRRLAALLLLLILAACGGGGGGGGGGDPIATDPPPAGDQPADPAPGGLTVGAITGFGSIFVNGMKIETESAEIMIEDRPGDETELALGQVVRVRGRFDDDGLSGFADSIEFEDEVEGPIEAIDEVAGSLIVLGQTVRVDSNTVFDDSIRPRGLDGLAVGQIVEISGFLDAAGTILASRIEDRVPGAEFEVKGLVTGLDSGRSRFSINALLIDFSGAQLEGFAGGMLAEGDYVEARGGSLGAEGELLATRIEREDRLTAGFSPDDEGLEVEIEGLITRFGSSADFDVAGFPIVTDAGTIFENGSPGDLALDVKVEAEGRLDADGRLVARKISIRRAGSIRIEAGVESIDAGDGILRLLGISVRVDARTRMDDDRDRRMPFGLSDIGVGDYLALRGGTDGSGAAQVLAARLERDEASSEVVLQGVVESVNEPGFVILGVTVQTGAATEFRDAADAPLGAVAFFERLVPGVLVKARGRLIAGAVIDAEQVEFELED